MTTPNGTSIASSVRRKVGRALSFDGSNANLRRVLSFDKTKKGRKDFRAIKANDDVTSEELWDKLRNIKTNPVITEVEVEGLLLSTTHKDMIATVQEMALSQQFQRFIFSDNVKVGDQFSIWKKEKDVMMREYIKTLQGNQSDVAATVIWQGKVVVKKGTSVDTLEDFLETLQGDLSCGGVSFEGQALSGVDFAEVPDRLAGVIDEGNLKLLEDISVHVSCGWSDGEDWMKCLEKCNAKLSKMLASKGKRRDGARRNGSKSPKRSGSGAQSPIRRSNTVDAKPFNPAEKAAELKKKLRRSQTLDAEKKSLKESAGNSSWRSTSTTSTESSTSTASSKGEEDKKKREPKASTSAVNSSAPRVTAKATLIESERSHSVPRTDTKSMLENKDRTNLSWKEFGAQNKQKLYLRRTQSLQAQSRPIRPTSIPKAA